MKPGEDCQFGWRSAQAFGVLVCAWLGLGLAAPLLGAADAGQGDEVFKLREVSVFEGGHQSFTRGQMGECQDKPFPEVKAYPDFRSKKPVYGSVSFATQRGQPNSGTRFHFAVDESQGTGKGYDRLYFDLNGDLDLRNDPVVKPLRTRPEGAELRWNTIKQQVLFDYLPIPFDHGPAGMREVAVMPRLLCSKYEDQEYKQFCFVRARLREGNIKVGSREYTACLGNDYVIGGRLDDPATALVLVPKGGGMAVSWWGGDRLTGAHKVDGKFFTFSASPTGDELTVHPYSGELGTFEVGLGGRTLDKLLVRGSLRSTNLAVPVGGAIEDGWPKAARRCQVPAGDYLPSYLTIDFGRLQINVSDNYHSEGKARDRGGRPSVYGMAVREEKPYVLDFSNRPEVMFTSPTNGQRLKLGGELEVKAVLIDPKLDIMIRGLEDTTRKQTKTPDGRAVGYQRNLSLDPKVIITRASGEKVAEGVMPFG